MSAVRKLTTEEYNRLYAPEQHTNKQRITTSQTVRKKQVSETKSASKRSPLVVISSVLAVALLFSMMTFVVMRYANISETKYQLFAMKSEIKDLKAQAVELQSKIDNSVVLINVEEIAIKELGMQYPTTQQIVYIDSMSSYVLDDHDAEEVNEPKEIRDVVFENIEELGLKIGALLKH